MISDLEIVLIETSGILRSVMFLKCWAYIFCLLDQKLTFEWLDW